MTISPNFVRQRDPNVNDARDQRIFKDAVWLNDLTGHYFRSDDDSPGAAIWTDITPSGGSGSTDWTAITNKPSTFPPSAHAYSSHTGIPSTFTPSAHTHPESEITNLVADLAGKAPSVHVHAQSDVTGLVAALASKQNAFIVVKKTTADETNATVNLQASTSLIVPVLANTDYIIEGFLTMRSSLATAGFKVALDVPTGATLISGGILHTVSNAGAVSGALQRADAAIVGATTGVDTISVDVPVYGHWVLRNVNAGNVVLMFAAEVAATITLRTGSVLRAMVA